MVVILIMKFVNFFFCCCFGCWKWIILCFIFGMMIGSVLMIGYWLIWIWLIWLIMSIIISIVILLFISFSV